MADKRREPRINISFPVGCNTLPKRKYFYTVLRDLSSEGAKIVISDFIAKGNVLKVNLNLINTVINLKAKVMWCNKERYSERYSAGLYFVEAGKQAKNSIAQFLTSTKSSQ